MVSDLLLLPLGGAQHLQDRGQGPVRHRGETVTCHTCGNNVTCDVFRVTSARTGPWVCCAAPASRARPPRSTRRGRQPETRAEDDFILSVSSLL